MNQDSFAYLQTLMGHKRKVNLLGECISLLELKLPLTGLSNRIYCLTVLKAESLRSRYWQDWFLLGAVRGLLFSHQVMSNPLRPHGRQHARLPYRSLSPRICSNSCPLSQRCHPTISSSVIAFLCHQSFLASEFFPVSWFFASGGQSTGTSALVSVLPMSIQGWFPLGLTGLISLLPQGRDTQYL